MPEKPHPAKGTGDVAVEAPTSGNGDPSRVVEAQVPAAAETLEDHVDIEEWMRENRTLVLVGSFAMGVLIGALLRR